MSDVLDLLTLSEGLTAVNMAATDHDTELEQQITAISRIIDAECGPVVQRTITEEIHNGGGPVFLRHTPVIEVTLVREASGSTITTHEVIGFGETGNGYSLDAHLPGVLFYRTGGYEAGWPCGSQIEVTYEAGRAEDTASVDARFKACAASCLRRLWKRESGTWAQSPDFFAGQDVTDTVGFYRIAKPIIDDMLADQRVLPGIA